MTTISGQRGFTLIEVTVSLALMGMIATILVTSLQLGAHSWKRVTAHAAATDEIARVQGFLRQRLSTIQPPDRNKSISNYFQGTPDTLEFPAIASGPAGDGLTRYHVGLSQGRSDTLELKYQRIGDEAAEWINETLLDRATGLSIQYLDSADEGPPHWVDRWERIADPPRLIKIDVAFAPTDPRRWPPLYIEPRMDTSPTCLFDVVSRRCRASE